jgi:hypothetical protein
MTRTPTLVAIMVATLGCGGGKPEVVSPVGFDPVSPAGFGDCVEPSPATTRALAAGLDDKGRLTFCRDDGEECRTVEMPTGAMAAHYRKITSEPLDQPAASLETDGQMLVCWSPIVPCLRKAPGPFETWLAVKIGGDKVAALSKAEHDRRFVTILDQALTTTTRFEVAAGASDLVWWHDGRFLIRASDGDAIRGHLYSADGTSRGTVGALGAGKAIDLGPGPVELAPGSWAFLSRDGTAVAAHDLERGDGVRIDLDVTGQPPGGAALMKAGDGTVAVVLGGAQYGDVLIVGLDARTVTKKPATRCAP